MHPGMNYDEVVNRAAPFLHRGKGVVVGMCHRRPLQKSWVKSSDEVKRSLNSRWMQRAEASKQNSP